MNEDQHEPKLPDDETPESEELWRHWIQHRRWQAVDPDIADRVMQAVTAPTGSNNRRSEDELLVRIDNSPWARFGVCSAAMLVGMLPFLYVAIVVKLLPF